MNEKDLKDFKLFARDHGVSSTTFDKYTTIINKNVLNPTSIASNLPGGMPMGMTPYIIEERQMNVTQMDVFSRLMQERIIFLGTGIDSQISNIINAQLLFLESVDSKKDITMYINSPGGEVYSGLATLDVMDFVSPDINTVVTGIAASMAFVLASNGTKGKRFALKHSRLMQHQPMGGVSPGTQATDMEITVNEINKLKKELYDVISKNSGQSFEKIENDCNRDYWMTAEESKKYGIIDSVILKRK
jgi:ATP-dependent Clp protease protease subunit